MQIEMVLAEHDDEVVQRGLRRPERAGECRIFRGNGEQKDVIDRQQRPQQDRDRDQPELGLSDEFTHRPSSAESRLIMKYNRGRTNGSATAMVAIAWSTWSSRM